MRVNPVSAVKEGGARDEDTLKEIAVEAAMVAALVPMEILSVSEVEPTVNKQLKVALVGKP